MNHRTRPNRLLLTGFITIIAFWLAAACGCTNKSQQPIEYYCAEGFYLQQGVCVPEEGDAPDQDEPSVQDGDRDIEPHETSDGDIEFYEAIESDMDSDDNENLIPVDADIDNEMDDESEQGNEAVELDASLFPKLSIKVPSVLALGNQSQAKAYLDFGADALPMDVTSQVQWTSYHPNLASISEQGRISALALGDAMIRARHEERVSEPEIVRIRPREQVEARGLWVNRWSYHSAQDVRNIIEKAHNSHFNQIYFQVRGVFDAYYHSSLEPWASSLSGRLGQEPGWDPLQTAIDVAHEYGMELHAWINVLTLWSGSSAPTTSTPIHKYREHPEWVMQDQNHIPMPLGGEYIWASPGNSLVREHNALVAREIVSLYDVDGIHLDRIRYPGPNFSYDPASRAAYQNALQNQPNLDYADWERSQVVLQVSRIYEEIQFVKPQVVLSAAVAGIYKDKWNWGGVTEGYHHWLQDPRAMVEQGVLDVVIPMIYWPITTTYGEWTDFKALTDDHAQSITTRMVLIGSDLSVSGDAEKRGKGGLKSFESFEQIRQQIDYTRQQPTNGWALYDYSTLESVDYWDDLLSGPFGQPAEVPVCDWKF